MIRAIIRTEVRTARPAPAVNPSGMPLRAIPAAPPGRVERPCNVPRKSPPCNPLLPCRLARA